MMPGARGRRRSERGTAVVDFVMILFVLLPLFAALFQLALVLHVRNTLSSAAAEGARRAAVSGATMDDGRAKTIAQIRGTVNERYAENVDIAPVSIGGAPGYRVVVTVTVPVFGIGGPGIEFAVSGSAIRESP